MVPFRLISDDKLWLQNKTDNVTNVYIVSNGSVYDIPKTSNITNDVAAAQV
jgi:hypothetical protein